MSDHEYSLVMLGVAIGSIGALLIGLLLREMLDLWEAIKRDWAALRLLLKGMHDYDE